MAKDKRQRTEQQSLAENKNQKKICSFVISACQCSIYSSKKSLYKCMLNTSRLAASNAPIQRLVMGASCSSQPKLLIMVN